MSTATVSIRELRTDFRGVKRKVEAFGQVVVTDNGVPSYRLTPVVRPRSKPTPMPDYYARLLNRQPKPMSEKAARTLWEEERGGR